MLVIVITTMVTTTMMTTTTTVTTTVIIILRLTIIRIPASAFGSLPTSPSIKGDREKYWTH